MGRMDFDVHWIFLIMRYINISSFSFLINEAVKGNVTPTKSLCQGCPLSLYLFLLCAEGFSATIARAKSRKQVHGLSIAQGVSKISNFFFSQIMP